MFEVRIILLCSLCLPSILLASTINGKNFSTIFIHLFCVFAVIRLPRKVCERVSCVLALAWFFLLTHFRTFHASNEYCAFQFCSKSTQNFSLAAPFLLIPFVCQHPIRLGVWARALFSLVLFIFFFMFTIAFTSPFANSSSCVFFHSSLTPIKKHSCRFYFRHFVPFVICTTETKLPSFRCVPVIVKVKNAKFQEP